eukprot:4079677-Amphidinium_carterae.1
MGCTSGASSWALVPLRVGSTAWRSRDSSMCSCAIVVRKSRRTKYWHDVCPNVDGLNSRRERIGDISLVVASWIHKSGRVYKVRAEAYRCRRGQNVLLCLTLAQQICKKLDGEWTVSMSPLRYASEDMRSDWE